ncbi:hypothetical protein, partial [Enterococcus faecium]
RNQKSKPPENHLKDKKRKITSQRSTVCPLLAMQQRTPKRQKLTPAPLSSVAAAAASLQSPPQRLTPEQEGSIIVAALKTVISGGAAQD